MENAIPPDPFAEVASAEKEGLEAILVGGNAVNLHAYLRATYDVDLLVREDQSGRWISFFEERRYRVVHRTANFARLHFAPDPTAALPIDLMLADQRTFDRLKGKARPREIGDGSRLLVASALHLVAMKLHALRNPVRAEKGVDFLDVKHLIRTADIDIFGEEFREIAGRYATDAIRSRIERELGPQGS